MCRVVQKLIQNIRFSLGTTICDALDDPDVVEIFLNPDSTVWIEKQGVMRSVDILAPDNARQAISVIASSLQTLVNEENPIVGGELIVDGSRFEGMIPPVVLNPIFNIRKKATQLYTLEDYCNAGIMPVVIKDVLHDAVARHKNILVIGGTGSGKTTLVNGIINAMDTLCPNDRHIVVEDARELQSASRNIVFLRTTDFVNMLRLFVSCLRLRPDRLSAGEIRVGSVALALLKAWNTGHEGGITTIHANSVQGGLSRLEQLIMEASVTPMQALIGEAVDLCIFIRRAKAPLRRVTQAAWVHGFDPLKQTYMLEVVHDEENNLV